jgi:hypothetical protein
MSLDEKLNNSGETLSANTTTTNNNSSNQNTILTEDKFDKDVIPNTKTYGIIGAILVALGEFLSNDGGISALIYGLVGVMSTLGLCILLEGFSTVIKLLRKISEK